MSTDRAILESKIVEGVKQCANASGWANLAELGGYLRKAGITYGKLSKFLSNYQYMLEMRVDESITPPAVYAKLK